MINTPEESEDDLDVYAKKKMDHNSMSHMYKEIPDEALEIFQVWISSFSSVRAAYNQPDLKAHSFAQIR